jgi:hypothetical protein
LLDLRDQQSSIKNQTPQNYNISKLKTEIRFLFKNIVALFN